MYPQGSLAESICLVAVLLLSFVVHLLRLVDLEVKSLGGWMLLLMLLLLAQPSLLLQPSGADDGITEGIARACWTIAVREQGEDT